MDSKVQISNDQNGFPPSKRRQTRQAATPTNNLPILPIVQSRSYYAKSGQNGLVRQLSRVLYKSALFMQNKANLPGVQN
jgi:hypothetical protein